MLRRNLGTESRMRIDSSLYNSRGLWRITTSVTRKIGEDELFTRSAALSYYFILSLFPLLLFLVSLVVLFSGPNSQLHQSISSALGRLAPGTASNLVQRITKETYTSKHDALKVAVGIAGTFWAASGATSAIMTALNVIHKKKETRPWWKRKLIILSLTLGIAALFIFAQVLALYGGKIGSALSPQIGLGGVFHWAWKILQWPLSFAAMFFALSLLYYFAPNVKQRKWRWITPGSIAGVALWVIASIGFRVYLDFFNRYSVTYGSLGAVIILLLWLYITGFAILIGGEVDWVIANRHRKTTDFKDRKDHTEPGMTEAA